MNNLAEMHSDRKYHDNFDEKLIDCWLKIQGKGWDAKHFVTMAMLDYSQALSLEKVPGFSDQQ